MILLQIKILANQVYQHNIQNNGMRTGICFNKNTNNYLQTVALI